MHTSDTSPAPPTASLHHRVGRWCARRAWWVTAAWFLAVVAAPAAGRAWGGAYEDDVTLCGTDARSGADLLGAHGSPALDGHRDALAGADGVAAATEPAPTPDGTLLVTTVTPATGPQGAATGDLAHRLADEVVPAALSGTGSGEGAGEVYVTGTTAARPAFRDLMAERLPLIVAAPAPAAARP